ncbi:hypothetical protein CU098_006103 [Rhizopus stolonifer]|uniref:Protein kinase domain-containing protein n=1 Tax=Rhizopus stolonifer TaxID=4846 RepID=A0A367J4R9_RHIST|nr:hypothetical protein CU098_006103 [Rhizopus stolonifer]
MTFWLYLPFYCQRKPTRIIGNRYRLMRQIGRGSSGLVHLAVDVKTRARYAVKEVCRPWSRHSLLESNILKQVGPHKNIIQLIDVIQDSDSMFLVMEMAKQGTVMDIVPHSLTKPYSNTQCRHFFKQLLDAVDHLHQHDIIHRDIKPENILLSNQTIKLVDFGSATRISEKTSSHIGSPAFMAPELLKKVPHNPTSCDVWAMGVTLYCLAYGHLPFQKPNFVQLYQDILTQPVSHTDTIDVQLKDLINQLLQKDPTQRITLDEAKVHPWMTKK